MAFPKIEGYVVTEKLGSGSYSTVYKAYTKVGARSVVAIKCIDKSRVKHSGRAIDNLVTEIRLLKTLTHPHIVQMKHFTWDDKNIYIITEYCCGGDLSKYIHRYGRVPEKQVLFFLQQLASALKFMREKGVVHMDLKPHNLLLHKESNQYILKVADFGFAQYMTSESLESNLRGSPLYMAPEMFAGGYDARVDLWSVGVIMYECLFGRAPYSSVTFKELMEKVQNKAPIEIPRNASISSGCRDLLMRLLQHDPAQRISYEEFFDHPYLDLDHMPSQENYIKAVNTIKQAIHLDRTGHWREALDLYCSALRTLVPLLHSRPQPALRAKVTRYMERAEEIKQRLKCEDSGLVPTELRPAVDVPPDRRTDVYHCCGGAQSTNSYDFGQHMTTPNATLCYCISHQVSESPSSHGCPSSPRSQRNDSMANYCRGSEPGDQTNQELSGSDGAGQPQMGKSQLPRKFSLRRLLQKDTAEVPYLNSTDIIEETGEAEKKEKVPVAETTSDFCKIT